MKAAVPFLVFLSGSCMTWTEALTVKGLVGGTVRIKCTHTNAGSNTKYFCKGECRDKDVLITSKTGGSEKYSIEDKGNTFFTTIRNLLLKDTGNYRCGIGRIGPDTYVEVYLKVDDVEKSDVHAVEEAITTGIKPTARPTDFENESSREETVSDQLTYIGAALGVAVLVLALVLLTFCRIKRRRAAFFSDKNKSTNECPGDPRRNSLLPASLTNPRPDSAIYSNVSGFPMPQDQPDESVSVPSSPEQPGDFYSNLIYNNDSKGVALITDTDSAMYSTIQKTH
ncbi:CMRF35-like molecule 9 isoform X5 [Gadus morhua]|uniref:CMRF35-like molecule 9 isoform X5 n=1 Tax=Gadus morhua TaxID=8049 RepID=UPI0011B5465B|nr:CMRF35-like molecule 9 isoform X5 [Gadus morhua]